MNIPHMTEAYAAAAPMGFVEVCKANALQMAAEAEEAQPGFWREFCQRQVRFWQRMEAKCAEFVATDEGV